MKAKKIIILLTVSLLFTSCLSKRYVVNTHFERNGTGRQIISTQADTLSGLFPYNLAAGWETSSTDTVAKAYLSQKNTKMIQISKKFNTVEELSSDLLHDMIFPVAKESLKKCFRWFYTFHRFTAIYPELSYKGQVAIGDFLTKEEQKLYFQGDLRAYKGLTGMELKEILDGIEERFLNWYNRTVYEECFQIIIDHIEKAIRPELLAVKDTLYSIHSKQLTELSISSALNVKDLCPILDKYFETNRFSNLYATDSQKMDEELQQRNTVADELLRYSIQYELTFPGKVITANTQLKNNGALVWEVHLFKYLADDYILTAEWRTVNVWAFAVTFLLIVFALYFLFRG